MECNRRRKLYSTTLTRRFIFIERKLSGYHACSFERVLTDPAQISEYSHLTRSGAVERPGFHVKSSTTFGRRIGIGRAHFRTREERTVPRIRLPAHPADTRYCDVTRLEFKVPADDLRRQRRRDETLGRGSHLSRDRRAASRRRGGDR